MEKKVERLASYAKYNGSVLVLIYRLVLTHSSVMRVYCECTITVI